MLNRLKNLTGLLKRKPKSIKFYGVDLDFSEEDMAKLKAMLNDTTTTLDLGEDGGLVKGEFLPDMTESEVLDYERKERLGWKEFKLPWQKNDTTN